MAFKVNGVLDIRLQGLNLNCGRYCMDTLMRWTHGTKCGAPLAAVPATDAFGIQCAPYGAGSNGVRFTYPAITGVRFTYQRHEFAAGT